MKKEYVRPMMISERFLTNEYFSACGKTESGEYIFTCDAPAGDAYKWVEEAWYPIVGTVPAHWDYMGDFTPCDATHRTSNPNSYESRAVDVNGDGSIDESSEVFLYWYGPDEHGRTGHFTASLTPDMVEVVRS